MEDQDCLLRGIAAAARRGLGCISSKEELLDLFGRVDVDSARDMPALVLVLEPAVDHVERRNLRVIPSVDESIEL